jgi:hydroxymethylbilane synthase
MAQLTIAICSEWQRNYVVKSCQEKNIDVQITLIESDFIKISEQLLKGNFDVLVQELSEIPIELPENVAITALSERFEGHYVIFSKNGFDENLLLGLASDAVFSVKEINYLPALLQEFSANYTFEKSKKGDVQIFPHYEILENTDASIIKILNPKEFPPLAGQGVLAFLCNKEDTTTRKIVRNLHHKEVSNLTNTERTFQKIIAPNPCGVFCEQDKMENYHLWAAVVNADGTTERVRASSSTIFGLAETAVQQIGK